MLRVIDSRTLDPHADTARPVAARRRAQRVPGRSGDLHRLPKTNWIWVADDGTATPGDATTHGTAYPYDTRVPLLLFGVGVRPGPVRTVSHAGRHRTDTGEDLRRRAANGDRPGAYGSRRTMSPCNSEREYGVRNSVGVWASDSQVRSSGRKKGCRLHTSIPGPPRTAASGSHTRSVGSTLPLNRRLDRRW